MTFLESWKNIPNTAVQIPSWGTVELKYISSGDMERFTSFIRDTTSSREFVASCLLNQIVSPTVSLENVLELPDVEMETLARALITSDPYTFKYFAETGEFFGDFRQAIDSYITETTRQLMAMIHQSLWFPVQDIFKNISLYSESANVLLHDSMRSLLYQVQINIPQTPTINSIVLQGFSEQWVSSAASLFGMQSVIDYALQEVISANHYILETVGQYWKLFSRKGLTEAKAAHVLEKYGWLISPSLPSDMISRVVELSEDSGERYKTINNLFYNYFQANDWQGLRQMVRSWEDLSFSRGRYKILNDCTCAVTVLSGTGANPANVVMPALMAQIDGLISDYLSKQEIPWQGDYKEGMIGRLTEYKRARATTPLSRLEELTDTLLFEVLFANTEHKKLEKRHALNRHQIMHGRNTRYGRRDYMLRLFLILDSLTHLIHVTPPKPRDA